MEERHSLECKGNAAAYQVGDQQNQERLWDSKSGVENSLFTAKIEGLYIEEMIPDITFLQPHMQYKCRSYTRQPSESSFQNRAAWTVGEELSSDVNINDRVRPSSFIPWALCLHRSTQASQLGESLLADAAWGAIQSSWAAGLLVILTSRETIKNH